MIGPAFPASWTVRRARDAYLAENGFTLEGYDAKWTDASLFGIPFRVPNTKDHRAAIRMHDLHHVATGYGTDMRGEAEISAWESRRGLGAVSLYVASIITFGALGGVFLSPRRVLAAYRAAGRETLFARGASEEDYEALLSLTVGELRARLGVPRDGIVSSRELHARAPKSEANVIASV